MVSIQDALKSANVDINLIWNAVNSALKSWSLNRKQKFSVICAGIHGTIDNAVRDLDKNSKSITDKKVKGLLSDIYNELITYKAMLLDAQESGIEQHPETVLGQWFNVYDKVMALLLRHLPTAERMAA